MRKKTRESCVEEVANLCGTSGGRLETGRRMPSCPTSIGSVLQNGSWFLGCFRGAVVFFVVIGIVIPGGGGAGELEELTAGFWKGVVHGYFGFLTKF